VKERGLDRSTHRTIRDDDSGRRPSAHRLNGVLANAIISHTSICPARDNEQVISTLTIDNYAG